MRKVILGKSGLEVTAVGFGGIPIMRVAMDDAVPVIRRALDLGVNFIDTAAGYGDSEEKVGRAVDGRRDGLVLATKSGRTGKEEMLADIEQSRRRMGTDVIDLYQLHNVSTPEKWEKISAPGGALGALLEARDKGHIAHVGFTSHNLDVAMDLLDEDVFETVQFPFNLVTSEPTDELIPKSRAKELGFIVMKPLCGGQYEDAELGFKFLNAYPDLVPIPGIEKPEEIEQIVRVVESGQVLAGEEKVRAEKIAADLGKLFCRRCGYCMPCPEGVPIQLAMVFDSFIKRFPRERLVSGLANRVAEDGPNCVECGQCEEKCPYDLPIIATVRKSVDKARRIISE